MNDGTRDSVSTDSVMNKLRSRFEKAGLGGGAANRQRLQEKRLSSTRSSEAIQALKERMSSMKASGQIGGSSSGPAPGGVAEALKQRLSRTMSGEGSTINLMSGKGPVPGGVAEALKQRLSRTISGEGATLIAHGRQPSNHHHSRLSRTMSGESSDSNLLLADASKITTQLKTYLKLSQTMDPSFVINEKARAEISAACRLHSKSLTVAQLAVKCLKILVDKITPTKRAAVFADIMKKFDDVEKLVNSYAHDTAFAENYLGLILGMLARDEDIAKQMDRAIYNADLLFLKNKHPDNPNVQKMYTQITSIIQKYQAAQAKQQQNVQKEPQGYQANQQSKYLSSHKRSQSDLDAAAVDVWASESLVDDLLDDGTSGGNLLDWEDEQAISGEAANAASVASPQKVGERAEGQPKPKKPVAPRVYTAQRLKELQMQNTQKEQTIQAYNQELSKLQEELTKIQIAYQADKEIHASFLATMQETEVKFKEEIQKLKKENEEYRTQEMELRETSRKLQAEMDGIKIEMNDKNQQFEQMKNMVSQQMNEAKGHYIGVRQELEGTKAQLSALQEELVATENKLATTQQHLEGKQKDYSELQSQYREMQKLYEDSRVRSANLETQYNTIRADLSSKLATYQQELAKGQNDVRVAIQMRETFKAQVMKLKMENSQLLNKISVLERARNESTKTSTELEHLKAKNAELKARMFDLMNKADGGEELKKLQDINAKLKKEKQELIQMTEMLLQQNEG